MKTLCTLLLLLALMTACKPSDKEPVRAQARVNYDSLGLSYAVKAQGVLGKNLMSALIAQGPAYALEYCNLQALPLTDSVSKAHGIAIMRVSDRPRNPKNQANGPQLEYIGHAKSQLAKGEKPGALVIEDDNQITGYYPILTNTMCLQCHGNPETDILPATLARINEHYPQDQAKNYSVNQLRGIWIIEMPRH